MLAIKVLFLFDCLNGIKQLGEVRAMVAQWSENAGSVPGTSTVDFFGSLLIKQ